MAINQSDPRTRRLVKYWTKGEGAVRIRWGTNGSFSRCTRALSGKVRDPKGLCAELHKVATGEWPAEKGVESSMETEVFELSDAEITAALPPRAPVSWEGPLAPIGRLTGDRREFAARALDTRQLPLPFMFQVATGQGHGNSVVVATIDTFTEREGVYWGTGRFLDPRIVPEVVRAIYLLKQGVVGPSVDLEPDLTYELVTDFGAGEDEKPVMRVTKGRLAGATLVSKPAFADLRITVHDEDVQALLASAGVEVDFQELTADEEDLSEFAVIGGNNWQKMPLASRQQAFDADDAIARLINFAGGDPKVYARAFLWKQTDGDPLNKDSYRLPIADIINGKMTLVPHAVYSAAALLSGAHGGLPNIPDNEKEQIRKIITEIYDFLRDTFSDPRIIPMWQRGGREGATGIGDEGVSRTAAALTAAVQAGFRPPAAWFRNPDLAKPTPLTVTDDGRVFGHLAAWGVCHTGIGNRCVMAPHSVTDYRHFKVGTVITDDGQSVAAGKITIGAGHADPEYGVIPAVEHYDNTAHAVAAINVGEDGHGIWVAGALLPGTDDRRIAELRLSPLSGDWRRVGDNLELIAALAVNTPGFPVIRASGEQDMTLIAAGVVASTDTSVEVVPVAADTADRTIKLREIDLFLDNETKSARRARALRVMGEDK